MISQIKEISQIFKDHKSYKENSIKYRKLITEFNLPQTIQLILSIKKILNSNRNNPSEKLLSLRFIRQSIQTCSYSFLKLIQTQILPILFTFALFKKQSADQTRGKQLFLKSSNSRDIKIKQQYEQIGMSFLKLILQLIQTLADIFKFAVYQYYEYPSIFYTMHKKLVKMGVNFPKKSTYFKSTEKQKIIKIYNEKNNNQTQKDIQVEKFLSGMFINMQQKNDNQQIMDNHQLIMRILATADSNFIVEYISSLQENFEHNGKKQRMKNLNILNQLFILGQSQILSKINTIFLPKILSILYLKMYNGVKQDNTIRRFCYQILKIWNYLGEKYKLQSRQIYKQFSDLLQDVTQYRFFNLDLFQENFNQNYIKLQIINQEKKKYEEGPEQIENFNLQIKIIKEQITKIKNYIGSKEFMKQLQIEVNLNPIQKLPKINFSKISEESSFSKNSSLKNFNYMEKDHKLSRENSQMEQKKSLTIKIDQQQQLIIDQNTSKTTQNKLKKKIFLINNDFTPKTMNRTQRSSPVYSKQQLTSQKVLPKPPIQQQSYIIQPNFEPLQQSYHKTQEVQKYMMNKMKKNNSPTFLEFTKPEKFIISGKKFQNFTKVKNKQENVNSDLKTLRSLIPCTSRGKTSIPDKTQMSSNQVFTQRDKQDFHKNYESRIKDLQKKLEQSRIKESKYLQIIHNQSQEIENLKLQITNIQKLKQSSVNINQNLYLSLQNETLKNKISKLHFSQQRSKFNLQASIPANFNMKQPKGNLINLNIKQYDSKFKKLLLKSKQLLFKNDLLEIGLISTREQMYKLNIFYTFEKSITDFSTSIKSSQLSFVTSQLKLQKVSANKQEKQNINFDFQKNKILKFKLPELVIKYAFQEKKQQITLKLPVSIFKLVENKQITNILEFKNQFKSRQNQIILSQQIIYSKKIIKDIKALTQYFPKMQLLNPNKQLLYYEGKKSMKYGLQISYSEYSYLIKIVICPTHIVYIQSLPKLKSKQSMEFLQEYLSILISILAKEKIHKLNQ